MNIESKIRPLYLAKILYERTDENHFLTTAQLIDILKVEYGILAHRQTIKSEIELLRQFGLEIEEVKSTQNRYNLFGRKFETPELKLLIDAVESSKFITSSKSKELVDKISSLSSRHVAAELKRNVNCEGRIKHGNEKVYLIIDAINEAINLNRKISFQYFQYTERKEKTLKHNGESYIVTPLYLVWNGDYYYMIAVYDFQQKIVSFRVDRIAKIPIILKEKGISCPKDFDIDEYVNMSFRMFNSRNNEIELICNNDVMDAIIDRFGEDVITYKNDNNSFCVVATVSVSHVFYSWIFGFGGRVKIKRPQTVKDEYRNMVQAAYSELL